jgi:hypothetical protein
MSWSESLIKIAAFEVETRQQQLAEIAGRLAIAQTRLAILQAEGEAEALRAQEDAEAGWYLVGYAEGLKARKAAIQAEIDAILAAGPGLRGAEEVRAGRGEHAAGRGQGNPPARDRRARRSGTEGRRATALGGGVQARGGRPRSPSTSARRTARSSLILKIAT